MNRLQYEKSPYLQQHKENPVDWFAWGEEAFAKAKAEDKPVFLSIGYSTCHWCHVMERESFEDMEVAELLNRSFVSIKVDREERPDIDAVYMNVCQSMTGSGGWPLTILMTPEQKPFFAGTYFPKQNRYGVAGLMELLTQVERLWQERREELTEAGERVTVFLQQTEESRTGTPTKALLRQGAEELMERFDPLWGGFGTAPKFPMPHVLLFLLRLAEAEGEAAWRTAAEKTLEAMAQGGIFDQIGGGFSRYSTDATWLLPHFEKMLYDQAGLVLAYLEGYRQTGRQLYRRIAEKTLAYVLRELTGETGGFFCGQDADSDGIEGKYYGLTPQELKPILGETAAAFCSRYHITEEGNFHGRSIPNRIGEKIEEEQEEQWESALASVEKYRREREQLHKDDKCLTAWNGWMIAAFARASRLLGEETYGNAAKRAAAFVEKQLTEETGRLYLRYREGEAAYQGQLEDYACYAYGLLELYGATLELSYLERAAELAELAEVWFGAETGGGYLYAADGEQLIQRPKEVYDGAMPSGNSVLGLVYGRLAALTGERLWQERQEKQLTFLAGALERVPSGAAFGALALAEALYPGMELVCVSAEEQPSAALLSFLQKREGIAVLWKTRKNQERLAKLAPWTAAYPIPSAGEVYYLCRGRQCFAPQREIKALEKALEKEG